MYYSGSLNLKTQLFYDSYEDSNGNKVYKSGFMSPGYFTAAFGMDYKTDKGFLYWEFIKDYFEIVFFILVYLYGVIFIFFPHAVKAGYLYSRDLLKRKKL